MLNKIENMPEWLNSSADRNTGVVWQAVKAYRANKRQGTVGVKTRAMVSSTGKKPYEQKKSGNARRGSFVSPICVGGGVAHGPKARDYREALPAKMQKLALKIAFAKRVLSGTVYSGEISVASGKTKDALNLIKDVYSATGKTIVCLDAMDDLTIRSLRNLRGIVLLSASKINALDVMECRKIIISSGALSTLQARLTKV